MVFPQAGGPRHQDAAALGELPGMKKPVGGAEMLPAMRRFREEMSLMLWIIPSWSTAVPQNPAR